MRNRIIAALEKAEILGVDDYLLHSWDLGADEWDFALAFSYTDYEGLIYEFSFDWESFDNAVIKNNCITLVDSKGETVDIYLYTLNAFDI